VKGRFVRPCRCACLALAIALSTNLHPERAFAQDTFVVQEGKPVTPEQMRAMRRGGQPAMPPGAQPSPQPGQEPKPEDKDKKKEGDDAAKKKEADATVKRPEKPPRVPDPREFKVKLDDKGRVPPFNFIGQPWPDVMQWLASLGKCTLDWQELPNDYLNLTTDRPYPLDEIRDRINRALQARGFTSIRSNDVLSVFKIEKIDPSLVSRVEEEKLYDMKPYDYVKVSFELPPSMEVDKAKDDVKQVLSPTAKVFPLVTSHRLLIMDTVANLRTVSELFNTERMVQDGKIVPKEFFLKYARPQQVIEILYMMVGVDPKAKPAQTDPNAQQQQMQMMQQMQQQGRGADAAKMMQKPDAPKVYLAYNRQRNSVLVNAPPDLLKIIEQTIRCLDVPYGDAATAAEVGGTADNQRTIKRYPLQNLDPDKFVSTLEEIGGLSPYASFKVDDNNKTLFVLAPDADHKRIASLLHDFDGAGRHFKVIPLRRLPADAVAATINKMMAGQNDKKEEKRRPYWYYDFDNGGNDNKKKDTIQGFGVDADIENNRLLVWATDSEMERVQELLIQLGEVPSGQHDPRQVRVLESGDAKSTPELLRQLQEAWSSSGGSKLIIKVPPETKPAPKAKEKDEKDKPKTDTSTKPANDRSASQSGRNRVAARFAELAADGTGAANAPIASQAPVAASPADNPAATSVSTADPSVAPAPVTITVTPDGRLMLSSTDTAALDRMEEMIEKLSPPQRRFKVYQLQYYRAFDMWLNLKTFFKEDLDSKEKNNDFSDWWFGFRPKSNDDKGAGSGLSKRRKLLIDYDPSSNTVMIANASAAQTAEVEQLIKEYDKPPRSDSVEKRATMPIKIQYSRPTIIAAAVKEVYRDLLSSKDKEFDKKDQKGDKRGGAERVTIIDYPGSSSDDGDSRPSQIKVGFDGALSLGADDVSGMLIVSAQKGIFDDIVRMVHELDEQAAPKTTVQVYQTHGIIRAEALQKALDKAVGKAWLGNRPEQQPNQTGTETDKKSGNEHGKHNEKQEDDKK
jgi:type II secretory pathway component GspD/PulD (secretin)